VCRACGSVREGTAAATMRHHAQCRAVAVYGKMLGAVERGEVTEADARARVEEEVARTAQARR